MKNILNILILLIVSSFSSCTKTEKESIENNIIDFKFTKTSSKKVDVIKSWYEKEMNLMNENQSRIASNVSFDFNNVISHNLYGNSDAIIINQNGLDPNNTENWALVFIDDDGNLGTFYYVKTINVDNDFKMVEYYDFWDEDLVFTSIYNNYDQTWDTIFNYNKDCYGSSYGQAVMDCLQDAYANHGWISVWASVQSAFIPQTAVALAGACAWENLNNGDCYDGFL